MRKLYLNSSLIKQAVAITVKYACFIHTIVSKRKGLLTLVIHNLRPIDTYAI